MLLCGVLGRMSSLSRVARRYLAYKYDPKEKKQSKVDRLMRVIRDATGLSRGVSEDIADAVVRNREVERLAVQKGWPLEGGVIEGPAGTIKLEDVQAQV